MSTTRDVQDPAVHAIARARALLGLERPREGHAAEVSWDDAGARPDPRARIHADRLLSDGYTNSNHLLHIDDRQVVMRVGNPQAARLGIDRLREAAVWRAAAATGLSPALLAFDAVRGDAMSAFVPVPTAADLLAASGPLSAPGTGDQPAPSAPITETGLRRIATALQRTHALRVNAAPLNPADVIAHYIALGAQVGLTWPAWVRPLLARLREWPELQAARRALQLTHHDFNPWNLLWPAEGELLVLDWEYAAPGDPLFDVVTVFTHLNLEHDARETLLVACGVSDSSRARLPALETLFHLREYAWAGAMRALGDRNPMVQSQFDREAGWLLANSVSGQR